MTQREELPERPMRPISAAFGSSGGGVRAADVRMVATDVDGTLTRAGVLDHDVVQMIARLGAAGIEVVPVSGRPAGEVLGLARYLPGVRRAIAENGLLEIVPDAAPRWIDGPTDLARLRRVGELLNRVHGAGLALAGDAFCRMGDVAYERDGRTLPRLLELRAAAEAEGVHLIWSNVHVHLAQAVPDKGAGLLRCLERWNVEPRTVVTVGDAPNDVGLFVPARFGASFGTADVRDASRGFDHLPAYVSNLREADAFLEVARALLDAR